MASMLMTAGNGIQEHMGKGQRSHTTPPCVRETDMGKESWHKRFHSRNWLGIKGHLASGNGCISYVCHRQSHGRLKQDGFVVVIYFACACPKLRGGGGNQ